MEESDIESESPITGKEERTTTKVRIRDRKPQSRAMSVTQSKLNLRMQMKLLEEDRQERESQIGSVHRYILESAALLFGVTVDDLIEGIIDSEENLETFNTLFQPGGRCVGIVHYQMEEAPGILTGRWNPTLPKHTKIKSAAFTSGDTLALTDMGVIAYRLNAKKPIESKNVADDIYLQPVFVKPPEMTVCDTVVKLLDTSIIPAIHAQSDWGELNKTEPGRLKRIQFLDKFDRFVHYLKEMRSNVDARVTFNIDYELYENYLYSPAAAKQALSNVEVYRAIHSQVRQWIRQMNHVIVERNQLRREDDSFGPFKELDYWRRELAKFESVIEQIKRKKCQMYLFYVMASKCELGKEWRKVDNQITACANEARDIVTYLYTLVDFFIPFYTADPIKMGITLPSIIYAIRMIYGNSRYFNTTERISALFVKMTNQIINVSRSYLTENNTKSIWKQKKQDIIKKLEVCLNLYTRYYHCYRSTNEKMAEAGEKLFGCSETYIFGKLETFKKRLESISDILETTMKYSILDSSTFEGIAAFAERFRNMFKEVAKSKNDPLDHRKTKFDEDYIKFKSGEKQFETDIYEFLVVELRKVDNVDGSLRILARLYKLGLPCLEIEQRYLDVSELFQAEIGYIRDSYNESRQKPQLGRCLTPIAGRIMWVRQLYRRIEAYMDIFRSIRPALLAAQVQKCVMMYNSLCMVFQQYEDIYHEGWYDYVDEIQICLAQPILLKHPITNQFIVNYDVHITETIRESDYMFRLNLDVPDVGQILSFYKHRLYKNNELVKAMVTKNNFMRDEILQIYRTLGRHLIYNVQESFKPAFSTITWTSLLISEFCDGMNILLDRVHSFFKRVTDIKDARVDPTLNSIRNMILIKLPVYAVDSKELLRSVLENSYAFGADLEKKSHACELSVIELVNEFMNIIDIPDFDDIRYKWLNVKRALKSEVSLPRLKVSLDSVYQEIDIKSLQDSKQVLSDAMDLFLYFSHRCVEFIISSMRDTFDVLRKRVVADRPTHVGVIKLKMTQIVHQEQKNDLLDKLIKFYARENKITVPIVQTYMELLIPNFSIKPPLEDMDADLQKCVQCVISIPKMVTIWGQNELGKPQKKLNPNFSLEYDEQMEYDEMELHSCYDRVRHHKESWKARKRMANQVLRYQEEIDELCQSFQKFAHLWNPERDALIKKFADSDPIIVEIREEFLKYRNNLQEVLDIEPDIVVGNISVLTERAKLGLEIEARAWTQKLGKLLSAKYQEQLDGYVDFIKSMNKCLNRKIETLDDIRIGMNCLVHIRETFIETDWGLELIEQAYALFSEFKIDIPKEDYERVDGLRFSYQALLEKAENVQMSICEIQGGYADDLVQRIDAFGAAVDAFATDFEKNGPMVEGIPAEEASKRVTIFQQTFDDLWETMEHLASGEKLFGMYPKEYPILFTLKRQFTMLNRLYGLYNAVMATINAYTRIPWSEVDMEAVGNEVAEFENRYRKMPKGMRTWPAYIDLSKKISDFNSSVPLLTMMASKAMLERHWDRLTQVTGFKFDVFSEDFTLGNILQAPLLEYKLEVEDICISAIKEAEIDAKLKAIIAQWTSAQFRLAKFKQRGEIILNISDVQESQQLLDDTLMIMNSLITNRFNVPFRATIATWGTKLQNTATVLEKWIAVQMLWIYLEAVFVGGDIAKQMPTEAKRFMSIDKQWIKVMARARDIPQVIECCVGDDSLMIILPFLLSQLEMCQKGLAGYLERKRAIFPRFFFISDPQLLEILGQASNPASIQPYLLGLFDAVNEIGFDEKLPERVVAIMSTWGEVVPLERHFNAIGGVEIWLGKLLASMRETMNSLIYQVDQILRYSTTFDIIYAYPTMIGQVALLAIQIYWTAKVEEALRRSVLDKTIMRYVNSYFLDELNDLIEDTTKILNAMERTQLETMITIHLHQKDIMDELVHLRVKSPIDFEWQKQARFYYGYDYDNCLVRITDVLFIYQNEYLGVTERLCITPLTDRCYITLAQAIWMNQGGAPAGPAGTGKTETTKDMGRALGKFVVVFNCSDQMDFRGLGRIFKGLAQSGSWGCFDEFNRIDLPVLSVAAQQIYIVLMARKHREPFFIFSDGDTVDMNIEFGIFLTMNPGYAGRQELPENLKVMFRTVAMMVPDRQIIIRVKLASCGFKNNTVLARKFFTLYTLCEGQLSKQVHYDFGLRNILSVLRTLGAQKRSNPEETEETIVMRVLREMNASKMTNEDSPLLLSLIDDMFPGIKLVSAVNKQLQKAIANQTAEMGLINSPDFNLKIVQLNDTSLVRHGLMTLGPTGSGKTSNMHVLQRCFTEMGRPHFEMRMNPKAITAPQMFGRLDVATNDWTDGIFSTLWRRSIKVKPTNFTWLVLDGPVDAVWIENLNSVLDDNKTLTLANGDRIVMAANAKIVFEPDNVDNASPATVSRMGMVFISSSVLGWSVLVDGWLLKRSQQENRIFRVLFNKIYDDLLGYVIQKLFAKMKILEAIYIRQTCDVISALIENCTKENPTDKHLERFFLFALMWSLGALLELDDREKFQEYVFNHKSKMLWPKVNPNETIFEYTVNENGNWIHWNEKLTEYIYPPDSVPDYNSILVPNVDNVRTNFLIDITTRTNKPILLIGEQGTAKTVMIKGYLKGYDPEYILSKSLNFSSATLPEMFQRIIESYVEKRVATSYGPPGGRKMTVFIDDINMPRINNWGDQITNEIVRQLMEFGGFYSLDKPGDFLYMLDMLLVGAMIHPGGGRNDIPARLKRRFCIFNCTLPSDVSMDKIFSVIGTGYFCKTRFPAPIVDMIPKLVPLTRRAWQQVKTKMLPTPAKFHYIFNLRDLSRIWQGILNIHREECSTKFVLMQLWLHECTRVIADRFTNADDKNWFLKCFERTSKEMLEDDFEYYPRETCYFVDFLRAPPEPTGDEPDDFDFSAPKVYEHWKSKELVLEKIFEFQDLYNESIRGTPMDLVFFDDALTHLLIISRIIRTPRGNALLVGVGGSGKQSLTRLATFIANYVTYQITLTRSYNINNLVEDFKYLYKVCGYKGDSLSFIFTDNEIKDEAFLEYFNNVLSSGEIANLFPKEELDELYVELMNVMRKEDPFRATSPDNLYSFFIDRSRANLHIVLCFSPVGEKFRNRSLKFPGLISGCTVDWFVKWPKDALDAVAAHILRPYEIVCTPEVKQQLILTTAFVHDSVQDYCVTYFNRFRRQVYVTPKSFLTFLDSYKKLYVYMNEEIGKLAYNMSTGLSKLSEAAESVNLLRKELEIKNKEIAIANKKAEEILIIVMEATRIATKIKEEAEITKKKAEVLVSEISKSKAIAHEKLAAAEPALKAAEKALETIKGEDIATVKKLGKPPYVITLIMDVVIILFKRRLSPVVIDPERNFVTPSWGEALRIMAGEFLKNLWRYPKDEMNAEIIDLMTPYLQHELYNFETAKKACGNVAGLTQWTVAMKAFYEINKDVLPLKANLAKQEAKLGRAMNKLNKAMALLKAKEEEVAECQRQYDAAMEAKRKIMEEARLCKEKMDAATALIIGLSDEKARWTEALKHFKEQILRLVGDVLILVGFLSYTGPFNQEYRNSLLQLWQDELGRARIPFTSELNIIDALCDQPTIAEWGLQGLPNDDLSIQNGIIVTKAGRYPLLIDPQSQGKTWIERREKENNLVTTTLGDKWFRQKMEDCISLGYPILLVDIMEELDPVLDSVLEKNYIKVGNMFKVKLGDKEVDVSLDFRMYMTTKLPNPRYSPEVSARTSIIDFTVTMKGLEDQLLGRVILSEKRELEEERLALVASVTANKRRMKELEDNLLYKLTSTKGSLVDDVTVIQVLNVTKETAADIGEKLVIAKDTEIKISAAREEFRPVATRGSVLYFLIVSMADVNNMYQTSLVQFLELFDLSLELSTKAFKIEKRLKNIMDYLTYEVYRYKSRGLYEVHKYMFVLMLTLRIDLQQGNIKLQEFEFIIKGGAALDLNTAPRKPAKWITDATWLNLVALSTIPQFQYILMQVETEDKVWKAWFEKPAPEKCTMPNLYSTYDDFRQLLMIRAWCPDRIVAQSRKYIASSQGPPFAEPVILDYQKMFEESRPMTPLICFLSMGSDPTTAIEALAHKLVFKCTCMSMGQGQEIHARRIVDVALKEGGWVLLQNCHLGLEYMDELLVLLLECEKNGEFHEDFRLWFTTEGHDDFPIALLQICIKFTNEPPAGIKAGLKRTYSSINQDMLEYSTLPMYLPLIFGISYLHTIVQERRKFGPLGWNIPYEFNYADWLCCCMFVQNHLDDYIPSRGISWATVRYMFGEVHYGGRVTDDFDKRLLNTFCRSWFGDFMFSEDFCYYPGYVIMKFKNAIDYLHEIEIMMNVDPPQAYGLHPNADITYQSNAATAMLNQILSIQPKEGSVAGGETREVIVGRLANDMLSKTPKAYDPFEVRDRMKIMGVTAPMNIFLRQEIDRMQKVIMLVTSTLKDLLLGIEGTIIMNEELQQSFDCMYDARIPPNWLRYSWESSSLGFWFTELLERNAQFRNWCFVGRPMCFWMTGFFNPQGFLTSMRQEVARAHKGWALDAVVLHNEVTKNQTQFDVKVPVLEGVLVYGLFLDGAGWDKRSLKMVEATNKILYAPLPVVHIYAIYSTAPKDSKLYVAPLYKKPKRTGLTYIDTLWLPSDTHPDHWILRGVALLCDTK